MVVSEGARTPRILFVSSTRVGDAILSTGLLDHVIRQYPGARITVACGATAAPLFEAVPGLDRLIVLNKMLLSLHWVELWARCTGTFWDLIVDLRNAPLTYLLMRKRRRGMPRDGRSMHRIRRLARVLDLDVPPPPTVWIDDEHREQAAMLIPDGSPVLAIGPTANWTAKTWRPENFADLVARLTSTNNILPNACVALFGLAEERASALRLIQAVPEVQRIDLVGGLDLLTVAACLKRCAMYIGNDSGLMHLAAATGIPTLGLFGPTQESLYAPWGDHTAVVRTKLDFDEIFPENFDFRNSDSLMDSLTVDMAEDAARQLWQKCEGRKE